ncbi:metallophosphoesterase [Hymenobacter sp. J193]|uniref:metallophosphoesterase n=1 Tax=Hymenobacter sp. J193 TaxID=2898429 RepID=UPI002151B347|nr:metallophosphoesterase [Hymenobacter sp. J193]MCR5889201.1 metallophosphoesterase [Hymenobacter sp. J193]
MKNPKAFVKKLVKWGVIGLCGYGVITTLVYGQDRTNEETGVYDFSWSGLDALFNEEEFGFFTNKPVATPLQGLDGPYLMDSTRFDVDENSQLTRQTFTVGQPVRVRVPNADGDSFTFMVRPAHPQPPHAYPLPARLLAISDIEGNFNALAGFLQRNGVVDKQFNWIFGAGHLVLNGDFMDRGNEVTQVLWLLYKLEGQADQAGGKVHFILGNHEVMNLYGDVSHAQRKYIGAAQRISGQQRWDKAGQALYSTRSEMGRWLRSKNVIEKIGPYLFVHAGLKPRLLTDSLTIPELNRIARKYYGLRMAKQLSGSREGTVLSHYDGPYWDRSLSLNLLYKAVFFFNDPLNASYHSTTQAELEQILRFYRASRVVVGHSVVSQVTPDYEGKVLKIDVKHGQEKHSDQTQGLLIEGNTEYRVNGKGEKTRIGGAA